MYILINPDNCSGMGSYIWQTLRCIYNFPDYKYYIYFSNCLYKDHSDTETDNPFDYYFKQPFTRPKRSEIERVVSGIETDKCEYRDIFMREPTKQNILKKRKEYNDIINKYLKLNDTVSSKIDDFYNKNLKGKNTIGIHLRGTDHPDKRPITSYLANIDRVVHNYDTIFLATDEQERYEMIRNTYGDKVVNYNSIKSPTSNPVHTNSSLTDAERRKAGEDVIIEANLLAKCNFLGLGTNSNVNYLARAINPTVDYTLL
jgi:hypothetical protein